MLQLTTTWQRHHQLLLLAISYFAATYARFTLGPLQETIRSSLALSDIQIAWLQGPAVALPMAIGAIPVGLLVDRLSRVRLLSVFTSLSLLATAATALAPSLPTLIVSRCLVGFAAGAIVICAYSLICDLYEPPQRGRANMVATMGDTGAAPAAFALGGILLGMHGAPIAGEPHDHWRWALLWMCLPLIAIVAIQLLLREPRRTDISTSKHSVRNVWASLWRYRALILPMLVARMMVWIADGAVVVWAAPNFERNFNLSPERVGALMATALLFSAILGPMLGGPLADLCQKSGGPRRTMLALCIAALISIPAALFAVMPDPSWAGFMLAAFLTLGFCIGTAAIVAGTIVIPGELRGTYVAITITVGSICSLGLAPLIVTYTSQLLGGPSEIGRALSIVCVVMSILGALSFGSAARYFPGHPEAHPAQYPMAVQPLPVRESGESVVGE